MTALRVLAADDQRVVREGLAMLLGLLPDVEVVGTAADGEEVLALAAELKPDVILMDLRMPRMDGVEATRRLRERDPAVKVVVLTTYADDRSVLDALRAGALGYLTKDAGAAEIQQALHRVADGQAALDPVVQRHLVEAMAQGGPEGSPRTRGFRGVVPPGQHSPHRARGRGAHADREGTVQYGDRRAPGGQRGHGQEPRQPPAGEDRRAGPRPGRRLRVPARTRAPVASHG